MFAPIEARLALAEKAARAALLWKYRADVVVMRRGNPEALAEFRAAHAAWREAERELKAAEADFEAVR
ncbi:hypothetical protein [Paraburkholderia sp. HP33-1]|uniref:hypothetical protein n=1 Tax=Paraburkholderia sp. HP33-1 TaxID=2883243 RepID=UPI001F1BFCC5|nr:hypothetical protein [Paraburkholderia sp. HP33-1]